MEKYDNQVYLQGRIIRKIISPKRGSILLETTESGKLRQYNVPEINFFGNQLKELEKYEKNDFVTIQGTLQSYTDKKKKKIKQSVVANSITKAQSCMEEIYQTNTGFLIPKRNEVHIVGKITSIQKNQNVWNIYIQTVVDGRPHSILTRLFDIASTKRIQNNIKQGDTVCVIGTIQTKHKKQSNKKVTKFENFVAMEIAPLDKK